MRKVASKIIISSGGRTQFLQFIGNKIPKGIQQCRCGCCTLLLLLVLRQLLLLQFEKLLLQLLMLLQLLSLLLLEWVPLPVRKLLWSVAVRGRGGCCCRRSSSRSCNCSRGRRSLEVERARSRPAEGPQRGLISRVPLVLQHLKPFAKEKPQVDS